MSDSGQRIVGVLGGLGPEATLDFHARILRRSKARSDQEHLHLIINNNPKVHDRNAAVAGLGPSPGPQLAAMAVALERAGADFLVMVCNTAHAFQAEIEQATVLPLVSIIEETVNEALRCGGIRRVGLLATSGCLDARLYQNAFARHDVLTVKPDRSLFMNLLYRIKEGDTGSKARAEMKHLASTLVAAGAEVVIAACTEVPLVLSQADVQVPFISSTDVLVDATIAHARGTNHHRNLEG